MDRLIKLTGELDRYHGFGKPPVSLPEPSPPRRRRKPRRKISWLQSIEIARNRIGIG
jgi:hypothetical protein